MLATVAAADGASTARKKYSVFIFSEAEPHAMYAIYKQTRTLADFKFCVRLNTHGNTNRSVLSQPLNTEQDVDN